jgi:two-component system phosphate regulon sensor histidine kinase PhoR
MLFRRFYRVPTGNIHDVKGFGLGLNYVRIIARAHGGDVHCFSKPGKGSTFSLVFPKNFKI